MTEISPDEYKKNLRIAVRTVGSFNKLADHLGVTGRAVCKWMQQGRPPRTEYTGETEYRHIISNLIKGKIDPEGFLPKLDIKKINNDQL